MKTIINAGVSQFHSDENLFELLVSYEDGREIGHVISRNALERLAESFAPFQNLGDRNDPEN